MNSPFAGSVVLSRPFDLGLGPLQAYREVLLNGKSAAQLTNNTYNVIQSNNDDDRVARPLLGMPHVH